MRDTEGGELYGDGAITRRSVIVTAGAAGVGGIAGCIGASNDGSGPDDEDGPSGSGGDVVLVDEQLVTDGDGARPLYVDATVENRSGDRSGMIGVTVEWFDASGNSLGDDLRRLPTLGAGETWIPEIDPITVSGADVDTASATLEFLADPPAPPAEMALADSSMDVEFSTAWIRGSVDNASSEEVEYAEAQALVYDDQGRVLLGTWEGVPELEPEQDWSFELQLYARDRVAEHGADHEIYLASDGQSNEL